jgi:acyl-CoA thioesterase II
MLVSFPIQIKRESISCVFSGVVPPEQLHSTRHRFEKLLNDARLKPDFRPFVELALEMPARIDIRHCNPRDLLRPSPEWPARQLVWIKAIDSLPDDSHLHRSTVAYCSDRVLLTTALLPYALNIFNPRIKMQASLDHSMWFHDDFSFDPIDQSDENDSMKPIRRSADMPSIPVKAPVRADDWLLYELECPIAMNNRALTFGRIWTKSGRLVVSCVQEGVIRC